MAPANIVNVDYNNFDQERRTGISLQIQGIEYTNADIV